MSLYSFSLKLQRYHCKNLEVGKSNSELHIYHRDKAREKQRQKNLINKPPRQPRLKELPRKDHAPRKDRKETAEKRRGHQRIEDDEEMDREYRLLKKLRKGTLTESEYAEATSTGDDMEPSAPTDEGGRVSSESNGLDMSEHKSLQRNARMRISTKGRISRGFVRVAKQRH